jgi:putative flippase GtrA
MDRAGRPRRHDLMSTGPGGSSAGALPGGRSSSRRELLWRLMGFAAVSAVALPVAQLTLWICYSVIGMAAVPSNVVAVAVGAVPSYWLNRRWVWQRAGGHSVSREIIPFWTYTFLGLVLSTVFVAVADRVWGTEVAVALANIAGFGVLWLGKFVLLERVLFIDRPGAHAG